MKRCEKAALAFLVVSIVGMFFRPVAHQGFTLILCMIFMCITGYKYWREKNLRAIPYIAIGGLLLLVCLGTIISRISLPKPSNSVITTKISTPAKDAKPKKSVRDELNEISNEVTGQQAYNEGVKHLQK